MEFRNISILGKILLVVLFLSTIAAGIGFMGVTGQKKLAESLARSDKVGSEMLDSSRLIQDMASLVRLEFTLALLPSQETLDDFNKSSDDIIPRARQRLAYIRDHQTEATAQMVTDIDTTYAAYAKEFWKTHKIATDNVGKVDNDQFLGQLRDSATASRIAFNKLQDSLRVYGSYLEKSSTAEVKAAIESGRESQTTMIILVIVGVAAGFLIATILTRSAISNPLQFCIANLQKLSDGNLDVDIPDTDRRDEIGKVTKAMDIFRDNMRRTRELEAEAKEQEKQAIERRKADMAQLADEFEKSVITVVQSVGHDTLSMQEMSRDLTEIAGRSAEHTTAAAAAAEQASLNIQTVSSAATQLSASIAEITRQVESSTKITEQVVGEAESVNRMVKSLADTTQKIGDVVNLITDVASQTNLLALNATIEAARAGEAGKGFAVVANEVKNLANQTARATDEISTQIAAVQAATQEAVSAVSHITHTIRHINETSSAIASAVEEQGSATEEIARNVLQAAEGASAVSANIANLSLSATETDQASTNVMHAAQDLTQQSVTLQQGVQNFIKTIRQS